MLPKEVTDLLENVFGHLGRDQRQEAKKEPLVYLVSLLSSIKEELPEVSRCLGTTVMFASFDSSIDKSRAFLNRNNKNKKKLAKSSRK